MFDIYACITQYTEDLSMQKDVVTCSQCKYFTLNHEVGMCEHPNALPFPKANDFCSMGEYSNKEKALANSEELLKLVYQQRRQ